MKSGLKFCFLLLVATVSITSVSAQVISYFSWDNLAPHLAPNNPMIADVGPNGVSTGLNVLQRTPGHADYGISPGYTSSGFPCSNSLAWGGSTPGSDGAQATTSSCRRNIDMTLDNTGAWSGWFDRNEIDVSIWYRRRGESDSALFFSRGSFFKFGMIGAKLVIKYTVSNGGVPQAIPGCCAHTALFGIWPTPPNSNADTLPGDNVWRLYRFYYNQASGIATIYVDGTAVWSTNIIDQSPGLPMYWTGAPAMMIGAGADGLGWMSSILDDATVSVPGVLPIKLSYFDATVNPDYKINLKWETTREVNNAYFSIDKSTDGHTWSYLGRVNGSGTTDDVKEYTLVDSNPSKGENHYRLRQVDNNGAEYFLEYATANLSYSHTGLAALYPNPVNTENQVNLLFASAENGTAKVLIYDNQGRELASHELPIIEGMNHLPVNVDQLSQGLYFVKVFAAGKVYADKFFKGE